MEALEMERYADQRGHDVAWMTAAEREALTAGRQVDTDHGAYDALPVRDTDGAPSGAILTVFSEDGALAGYVLPALIPGHYLASNGTHTLGTVQGTIAGAVNLVAAHDAGIVRSPAWRPGPRPFNVEWADYPDEPSWERHISV